MGSFFLIISLKLFKYFILAVSATFSGSHVTRGLYTYVTASCADWWSRCVETPLLVSERIFPNAFLFFLSLYRRRLRHANVSCNENASLID